MSENEKKEAKTLEDIKVEDKPVLESNDTESQTRIASIDSVMKTSNLNKFDTFFIRIWAFLCSIIIKFSDWICKGIKFLIKRDIPRKYVTATVVIIILVLFILLIALPASANGTARQELDLYPNGLIAVEKRVGTDAVGEPIYKWGYANKKGAIKISCVYDDALDFKYGVAFVKVIEAQNGSNYVYWKLIDKNGKDVGDYQFIQTGVNVPVTQFSEDQKLAKVIISGRYGYVNSKGKLAIDAIYEDAGSFIGKIARVSSGYSYYFINTKGKKVSKEFDNARDIVDGFAAVNISGRWGFMNEKGNVVIEPIFDEVSDFYCGYAAVKQGTSYGVIDEKGKYVVSTGMFSSLNILEYFEMKK